MYNVGYKEEIYVNLMQQHVFKKWLFGVYCGAEIY